VNYIHATLHKALEQAVRWHLVSYNVSDGAAKPRQEKRETEALTIEQVFAFLGTTHEVGDRFEVLYVVAAFTGMRPGELLALKWRDLLLDGPEPVARVQRGLSKSPNGPLFKRTKTEKGRSITLLPLAVEALKQHRKRQTEDKLKYSGLWKDHDLVFPSRTGTPMSWDNLVKRNFKPLLKEAGLPQTVRFYDLRHTFATWMHEQRENPKIVQEILGHPQITHTMDTYSHVTPNMQRQAFARLGKRLK
jgi:integrase